MLVCSPGFFTGKEQADPSIKNTTSDKVEIVNSDRKLDPVCFVKPNLSVKKTHVVKPLSGKRHRRGKRNSLKIFTKPFSWVGNNIAGARSKWASVKRWVRMKSPSILSLQETKCQVAGKHNLDGYISYEHLRTEKTAGGGIYMAISKDLNPALVRDGGEKVEAITVDIFVKKNANNLYFCLWTSGKRLY